MVGQTKASTAGLGRLASAVGLSLARLGLLALAWLTCVQFGWVPQRAAALGRGTESAGLGLVEIILTGLDWDGLS